MAESELAQLQDRQWEHDRDYHHDIHCLSKLDRLDHYVHHYSKYVGRLAHEHDEERQRELLKKTIADASIVTLAAANTLDLDLQTELEETFGASPETIEEWTEVVDNTDSELDVADTSEWLFSRLAIPTGNMADGLESLDHLEAVTISEIFDEGLIDVFSFLMVASHQIGENIVYLIEERWGTIEEQAIR